MGIIRKALWKALKKFEPEYIIHLGDNIGIKCEPTDLNQGGSVKITIMNLENREALMIMTASDKIKIKVIDGVASIFRTKNKDIGIYAKDNR